ncbi:S24/S26 family peptidase [Halorussus marinus]|uniref:S26 family signal peptidase n=1 Tax=Halorussus marinus TaxID=2505976 RepID=UPI001092825F|nr:S26 family signal peptidase [Halorussus marinus]
MSAPRDDTSSDESADDGSRGDTAASPSGSNDGLGPDAQSGSRSDAPAARSNGPPGPRSDGGEASDTGPIALIGRFRRSDHGAVVFVRELLSSAAIVVAIGLLLFAASGVWPPMVAIESGSMEPQMYKGDLVFVMEEGRLAPDVAHADTGIVTYRAGAEAGYSKFNNPGDVIIYTQNGDPGRTPIIHRAMFWVESGENWYDEANKQYLRADNCGELANCPAPHAGFITKGDNNGEYDQARRISTVVKPDWVRGTAEVRIPWLGWVRLYFSGAA